jgi:hypothetical protein
MHVNLNMLEMLVLTAKEVSVQNIKGGNIHIVHVCVHKCMHRYTHISTKTGMDVSSDDADR